jgi:chitin synthase
MSQYGGFNPLPFMPFGGGFGGSAAGSEYGGAFPAPMQMQGTGSMYNMMSGPQAGMMSNYNMFGNALPGSGMSATGSMAGGVQSPFAGAAARPASTFSFATAVNPFAGPSTNENPSDEELIQALRNYLSTQDLMTVTKK